MRILLTGASGFLGSACVTLLCRYPDIELSVARASGVECSLPLGCHEVALPDLKDSKPLIAALSRFHPSHIIHLAALSSPLACEQNPERAYYSNVSFTTMLAHYAASVGAHLTTISTDLVFDGADHAPRDGFTELDDPDPASVYGQTKQAAEYETLSSNARHAVVRLSLLYGYSLSASRGVLGWMEDTWAKGAATSLFLDEYRTPVHVTEAAHAILKIATTSQPGIWHCGGPARLSRVEFGYQVADALHYNPALIRPCYRAEVSSVPPRPEDVSLNSVKLWKLLEWSPSSVHSSLRESYDPRKSV